jgi:hypothetical protein
MDPLGAHAAMSATRRSVLSAQPDAPVRPERRWRGRGARRAPDRALRRGIARGLHALADRLEPARPTPECC